MTVIDLISTEAFGAGVLVGAGGVIAGLVAVSWLRPLIMAWASGAPLTLGTVIGMRLRRTPITLLVSAHITLAKQGHAIPFNQLEARAPHLALVCSLGVERGEDPHYLLGLALWTSRPASGVLTHPLRLRELLAACFAAILVG